MSAQFDPDNLDRMRSNPDNYKWGVFYFNPQDPRTIVSKRNPGMGFTLNLASPYSYFADNRDFVVCDCDGSA